MLLGMLVLITIARFDNLGINAEEPLELNLSAAEIRPGDFVWIRLNAPNALKVSAILLEETTMLQPINERWLGMIPVSYNTEPGDFVITIKVETKSKELIRELPLRVVHREFPEDRIRVSEGMRRTSLAPANVNSDLQKVQQAREGVLVNPTPPLWSGSFIWPVKGRITTDFGYRRFVNDIPNGRHSGLDIAASTGTPIVATNRGRVILAESLHWTGQTIIVYHGMNLFSSYSHLSAMRVRSGDMVQKGAVIGEVGATGLATGPHLHLTFRVGLTAVDPYLFLEKEVIP